MNEKNLYKRISELKEKEDLKIKESEEQIQIFFNELFENKNIKKSLLIPSRKEQIEIILKDIIKDIEYFKKLLFLIPSCDYKNNDLFDFERFLNVFDFLFLYKQKYEENNKSIDIMGQLTVLSKTQTKFESLALVKLVSFYLLYYEKEEKM